MEVKFASTKHRGILPVVTSSCLPVACGTGLKHLGCHAGPAAASDESKSIEGATQSVEG